MRGHKYVDVYLFLIVHMNISCGLFEELESSQEGADCPVSSGKASTVSRNFALKSDPQMSCKADPEYH